MYLVAILGDNVVRANFVQFDNAFTVLGVDVGMLLQCTFKCFRYSVPTYTLE